MRDRLVGSLVIACGKAGRKDGWRLRSPSVGMGSEILEKITHNNPRQFLILRINPALLSMAEGFLSFLKTLRLSSSNHNPMLRRAG